MTTSTPSFSFSTILLSRTAFEEEPSCLTPPVRSTNRTLLLSFHPPSRRTHVKTFETRQPGQLANQGA